MGIFQEYYIKNIDKLSNEVLWQIMLFLPLQHLRNFIFSSKRFYLIQKNDNFWKERFESRFKHGWPDCWSENPNDLEETILKFFYGWRCIRIHFTVFKMKYLIFTFYLNMDIYEVMKHSCRDEILSIRSKEDEEWWNNSIDETTYYEFIYSEFWKKVDFKFIIEYIEKYPSIIEKVPDNHELLERIIKEPLEVLIK